MSYIPCTICGGNVPGLPCRCSTAYPNLPTWPLVTYATRNTGNLPAPSGWTCPRCSRVWGPHVDGCQACNPMPSAVSLGAAKSVAEPLDMVTRVAEARRLIEAQPKWLREDLTAYFREILS